MKAIFFTVMLLLPVASIAGTLSDFFKKYPDLSNNFPVHTAISKASRFEAAGFARREGGDEEQLMKTKGDDFAVLAFRRVKNSCKYPEAASMLGLTTQDCELVLGKDI